MVLLYIICLIAFSPLIHTHVYMYLYDMGTWLWGGVVLIVNCDEIC